MKSSIIKWIVSLIVIAVIATFFVVGNFHNSNNGVIKVGVIAPLTGQYASLGESLENAVIMAVGNDKRIQVIFEDDAFDGKLGLSAFQKLTNIDHVDIIINESSPTLEVITPIVAETHLPVIQIFEAKEHNKDSIFQMLPFSYPLFSDLASLSEQHFKRIALVYSGVTDVLSTDAGYFKQGLVSSSTLVDEVKIAGDSDMRSEVTKILATNPDAVTDIFSLTDGIRFIKELKAQQGNRKVSLICDANTEFAISDYIKALGTSTFEGCLSTNLPNLMTDSFVSAYKKQFNSNPMIGADWGYDAITIVKDLLNTPKDQWVAKIQSESFDGASGHVSFDENGTRNAVSERHIFQGGKFVKLAE